jgi:serine/threonine protein kinase
MKEVVGKGAFGEVRRAIWRGRGGGTTVAVKKISTQGADSKMKAKIFKEVGIFECSVLCCYLYAIPLCIFFLTCKETLHKLNYRHIVQIYGCFMTRTDLLIVLEFVPASLHSLLRSDAVLPWPARITYANFSCFSVLIIKFLF